MNTIHRIRRFFGLHPYRRAGETGHDEPHYTCTADVIAAIRRDGYQRRYTDSPTVSEIRDAAELARKGTKN